MEKKILVVAGEASGDAHAAHLVDEIKKTLPGASFFGLGGEKMRAAGVQLEQDITRLAVVGFIEVLKHYGQFRKIFRAVVAQAQADRPDAAILVDYPGFNLRLAHRLKKMGVPVIYFISPQVWAWGRGRIATIKRDVALLLVLFKFEEALYADSRFDVRFVGHPLLDVVKPSVGREQLFAGIGFKNNLKTVALLPGSRDREARTLLPVLLRAAQQIHRKLPNTQFLICRSRTLPRELFKTLIDRETIDYPYKMLDDDTYNGVAASDLALVASGTATLETAILNKPMVIVYKVSFLTWLTARLVIRIPCIGLVNVIAGKKIVPELLQFNATPSRISETALALLRDDKKRETTQAELFALKNTLGIPGAYGRAAQEIARFLRK